MLQAELMDVTFIGVAIEYLHPALFKCLVEPYNYLPGQVKAKDEALRST
jgi:hypothetical protein